MIQSGYRVPVRHRVPTHTSLSPRTSRSRRSARLAALSIVSSLSSLCARSLPLLPMGIGRNEKIAHEAEPLAVSMLLLSLSPYGHGRASPSFTLPISTKAGNTGIAHQVVIAAYWILNSRILRISVLPHQCVLGACTAGQPATPTLHTRLYGLRFDRLRSCRAALGDTCV